MKKTRISCVGDSITFGYKLKKRWRDSYPAKLQSLLGDTFEVINFGRNGKTLLKNGHEPYWETNEFKDALESNSNIVFIFLGTNDVQKVNTLHLNELKNDAIDLINKFKSTPTNPRVIIVTPVILFQDNRTNIFEKSSLETVISSLKDAANETNCEFIDLLPFFIGKPNLLPDGFHPNVEGSLLIANILFSFLLQKENASC